MNIALDLDGVLADLEGEMIERTRYDEETFETFGDHDDHEHFMSEAERVWRYHWDDIDPVEPGLSPATSALGINHNVDIVTNTAGPADAVESWLDEHGIVYDSIVHARANGHRKRDLDYDAYIDDKPALAGSVDLLYLRDQPWNQTTRGGSGYVYDSYERSYIESEGRPENAVVPHVIRITSLLDVIQDLATRDVEATIEQ